MSSHEDNCLFCKIADGKIPSFKVWEDDKHLAFLSIHPLKPGHTLVIPKKHLPYVFGIEDDELSELTKVSKKVAKKLEKAYQPKTGKIGVIVYGIDVDHTHVHLVPIDESGDLNFSNAKPASNEDLSASHHKITSIDD
jgi:histidine triad (HIT) family protein